MKNFFNHIRTYVFRGLITIIPLLLCIFAIQLLYILIDKRAMVFLGKFFEVRQIPGLGIVLVLACLYLIGLIGSNIVGRQLFRFIENITEKIPLIKVLYGAGKQLSQGLSSVDQDHLKKAVLVKIGSGELMVPAFVMGSMTSPKTGEEFLFVLIGSAPTPVSGFIVVVKSSEVIDPGWTVEECLKLVVSMGIVYPKDIKFDRYL